ncbi:F-box protein GID2 [Cajanus cajan]|uniref:F-box protein GID2 n=1 Tax=Cajanus cajan TaxID=3821 RepID=A0A151RPG5_CAJCA|nr:F-box protein GID2 [Cajanus cajan]KYP44403.1 F-box protein GID2 [Cajanus cajan]
MNSGEENRKAKKAKVSDDSEREKSVYLDDNVLFEVLKHVDSRSLAVAGCVSKQWNKTAQDERLWELICTRQWANTGCGEQQLRSVVLALGGFRRLYALYLWPLSKPHAPSTSWPAIPHVLRSKPRWGKDEVHLSLSLLSIRFYEKMNSRKAKNT